MSSPVSLGVSPAAATPTSFYSQMSEASFSHAGTLYWVVCLAPQLCLPFYPHSNVAPPGPPAAALLWPYSASSLLQLPISAPPTGLDEFVFFISWVVGLPYSSISCQFWLFFIFKLLLSFWLCEEAQCVYLRLHLGWKSSSVFYKLFQN